MIEKEGDSIECTNKERTYRARCIRVYERKFFWDTLVGGFSLYSRRCIPADVFQQMELEKIFNTCLKRFSYFGVTTVIPSEWNNVKQVAKKDFPYSFKIISEIDNWVQVCFETKKSFTICGI